MFLDYHARDASRLHVPPAAFLGRHVRDVLPPPVADALAKAFTRVAPSDEPEKVEYTLGADDDERFYEACIVRCDGDKILSIVRDITDRKRAELEADAHRRELAHLGRVAMLGELSGTLAHELSQPLTAVLSNAQAARRLLDRRAARRRRSCARRSTTSSGTTSGPARSSIACARCCGRARRRCSRSTSTR